LGDFRGIRRKIVEIHFSSVLGQARKQNLGRSSSAISCCARQTGGVSRQTDRISHLILFCASLPASVSVCYMHKTNVQYHQPQSHQQTTVFDRRRFPITRWRLFPLKTTCIWRAVNRDHSDTQLLLRLSTVSVENMCRYPKQLQELPGYNMVRDEKPCWGFTLNCACIC
jgi:hypothetical protein